MASVEPRLRQMRLSRPCYDKPHRCPGWAGGGTKFAKRDLCENGTVRTSVPMAGYPGEYEYPGTLQWRIGHCRTCGVTTLPYVVRWLDPGWWKWKLL